MAASRISNAVRTMNNTVESAKEVKQALYDLHVKEGQMFLGYKDVLNPKNCIKGMLGGM